MSIPRGIHEEFEKLSKKDQKTVVKFLDTIKQRHDQIISPRRGDLGLGFIITSIKENEKK